MQDKIKDFNISHSSHFICLTCCMDFFKKYNIYLLYISHIMHIIGSLGLKKSKDYVCASRSEDLSCCTAKFLVQKAPEI